MWHIKPYKSIIYEECNAYRAKNIKGHHKLNLFKIKIIKSGNFHKITNGHNGIVIAVRIKDTAISSLVASFNRKYAVTTLSIQ